MPLFKTKQVLCPGNTAVPYLSEGPKGSTRIIQLLAKRVFPTLYCTAQCVHNKRKKKSALM